MVYRNRQRRRMLQPDYCARCGSPFSRAKRSMRFCSRLCQRAALKAQDRKARALMRAALTILGRKAA